MFLLALAHPGCPGQSPESRKMLVVVVVVVIFHAFSGLENGLPKFHDFS